MADREMTMVFCYDITSPKLRARVADILEKKAVRVQQSVFEARMSSRHAESLFDRLQACLDPGDSLRMYAVSAAGLGRSRTAGGAPVTASDTYWLL